MSIEPEKANAGDDKRGGGNAGVQQEVPPITFALRPDHRKADFRTAKSSEVERFIKEQAEDLVRHNICRVFVLENPEDRTHIWGYYSLSAFQVARDAMSNKHRKPLRRSVVPMAILGYMGRDDSLPKGKFGQWLVQDAARRAMKAREQIGLLGLMLEAENPELANKFYSKPDVGFKVCQEKMWVNPARPLMYALLDEFPLTAPG